MIGNAIPITSDTGHEKPAVTIPLNNGMSAIVDADNFEWLSCFTWTAVKSGRCYYAKTNVVGPQGRRQTSMHRMVARTPSGLIAHHRNRNSLDNRRGNLLNLGKLEHQMLHLNNSLQIRYAPGEGKNTD